jgi:hypothetical protein
MIQADAASEGIPKCPAEVPKLVHSSPPLSPLAQMVVDLCPGDMLTSELL